MNFDHDVVIVGGGPSGLATAAELAHHGIASVLIEPRTSVAHDRPRAKTTSIRTMEHFRRWGIAHAIRDRAEIKPAWSQRVVFCDNANGSIITEFDHAFGLSAEPLDFAAETSQQIPQPVVEDVLREHLLDTGLVDFRLGCRVIAIIEHDEFVHVTVEGSNAAEEALTARFVIGCDGGWSPTRESIGASLSGTSAPHANLNVVFTAPRLRPAVGDAVHYWAVGAATPGALGPLDHAGRWWASLAAAGDITDPAQVKRLIADLVGLPETDFDAEIHSMDAWTPRMLLADRFASQRVFLVGESAHLNPPFGGHGFNTCVGDAVNIGWKLAAVIAGWGGRGLLESYEHERRHIAQETIESAATNLRASGLAIARTPGALQETKAEEFYSLGLVLGYSYAQSPVVATGPTDADRDVRHYRPSFVPGARLPHRWMDPNRSLYDLLGKGYSLLIPHGDESAAVSSLVQECRRRSIPLSLVPVTPAATGAPGQFVLVRPDQHIAWVGRDPTEIDLRVVSGHLNTTAKPVTDRPAGRA
ncbi:FAD-dependent monooxygenase [Gordonia hydrophobica]|nr:FAD-dependent monooxygenase [Gordonia hydrophobica]MBM7365471.1 2-polyprenyl-6-methoxyphenol hydroxylase-like FAD-dependent oxidoreductase [Gordonia hydrophobica]